MITIYTCFIILINSCLPITVVVPSGATKEAGAKPYAEKLPISPNTIKTMPNLQKMFKSFFGYLFLA